MIVEAIRTLDGDIDAPLGHFLRDIENPTLPLLTRFVRFLVAGEEVLGIDLSHWNHEPDFVKLYADGVRLVVFRTSFGQFGVDNKFASWWQKAVDAGMTIMVYHFGRQNVSGVTQANLVWNIIQPLVEVLGSVPPIVYDVETTDGVSGTQIWNVINSFFLTLLAKGLPFERQVMYTSPGFANANMQPVPSWQGKLVKWIAHWINGPPTPPTGYTNVKMQQKGICNDHPWVPCFTGILPDVDVNYFFGSIVDLVTFAGNPISIPPIPPVPPEDCPWPKSGKVSGTYGATLRSEPRVTTDYPPTGTKIKVYAKNTPVMILGELPFINGNEWLDVQVPQDSFRTGVMARSLVEILD